ncbi:hypothetical protein RHMOL_Rhmol03G0071500 [Rhododendron molle]|uniref:Uncharacterized protein n=1 Tax=Rhododendron molle TaxID=49168 RepID=A0ACC0PDV2_RHOML|nr:hypothetical protein RHMOL_Rhmol03G0071500 [Rhododendron molle]
MEVLQRTPSDFFSNPSVKESIFWTLSADGKYSAKTAWEACSHMYPIQTWYSFVWYANNVPRWSFILWLAV